MATPAKKIKTDGKEAKYYARQARKAQQHRLEIGDKGFLVTCSFKEKDCLREVYQLLNEYSSEPTVTEEQVSEVEDNIDIETELRNQIEQSKKDQQKKVHNFCNVATGVQNLLFVKVASTHLDPVQLGTKIVRDLAESKIRKSKFVLRLLPIATVCKANLLDIIDAGGKLFDEHFLREPSTFAINFNKRFNNDVSRDEVINELASLVSLKNPLNKVNLNEPERSIIVEIVKKFCLITVVPDFIKLKKYNLRELSNLQREPTSEKKPSVDKKETLEAVENAK